MRVSTLDQNTERQLDGITLDKVFTDKASGKDTKRPQLEAALDCLRDGDTFVVHSMDRLARNVDDLCRIVRELTARDVMVRLMKEGLTFSGEDSPMATLMLTLLGAVAEFERGLIRERQREGIAIAKAKGNVYKGRKPVLNDEQVKAMLARIASGVPKATVAREYKISRETLYSYIAKV